jgi:hypothetical protein
MNVCISYDPQKQQRLYYVPYKPIKTTYLSVWGLASAPKLLDRAKIFDMYVSLVPLISYDLEISRTACNIRDVTPGILTATDTCIGYHVTRFEASRNVILHTRYVSTCVGG